MKKTKNKSKGLALAISLGLILSSGSAVGTWSYFAARSETNSTINVTVGNLKTDFPKPASSSNIIEITDAATGDTKTQQFHIKNTGSLTQKVRLVVTRDSGDNTIPEDALDDITYTLDFKADASGESSSPVSGDLRNFNNPKHPLVIDITNQNNSKPLYLKPGECITGTLTLTFNTPSDNGAANKSFHLSLMAIGTQPNDDSWE